MYWWCSDNELYGFHLSKVRYLWSCWLACVTSLRCVHHKGWPGSGHHCGLSRLQHPRHHRNLWDLRRAGTPSPQTHTHTHKIKLTPGTSWRSSVNEWMSSVSSAHLSELVAPIQGLHFLYSVHLVADSGENHTHKNKTLFWWSKMVTIQENLI